MDIHVSPRLIYKCHLIVSLKFLSLRNKEMKC